MRDLIKKILLESRLSDAKDKYSRIDATDINFFSGNDPSGNDAYLDWMANEYTKLSIDGRTPGYGDRDAIIVAVRLFHKNRDKIVPGDTEYMANELSGGEFDRWVKNPKDINSYPNYKLLRRYGYYLNGKTSKSELKRIDKEAIERLYEDDDYLLIRPLTHRASCIYGASTKWCTTAIDPYDFNSYFKKGILVYLMIKNPEISKVVENQKLGFNISYEFGPENMNIFDEVDEIIFLPNLEHTLDSIGELDGFNKIKNIIIEKFHKLDEERKKSLTESIKQILREEVNKVGSDKIAVILDGTSSAGKSYTAKQLNAVPFHKAKDPNQWVVIDSDDFQGFGNEEERRRLKLDHPNIRDWAKGNAPGIVSGIYRKDPNEENPPENPYEDQYIDPTDSRLWYMAQEYKTGPWKKVIFDDIGNDIEKYVPNIKHKLLVHSPIYIMLGNVGKRNKSENDNHHRNPKIPLEQYLKKYEATSTKPSEAIGDPTTDITKSDLKSFLMDKMVDKYPDYDEVFIDGFISKLGVNDDNITYWIKVKDNYLTDDQVLINVGSDQQTYINKIGDKLGIEMKK